MSFETISLSKKFIKGHIGDNLNTDYFVIILSSLDPQQYWHIGFWSPQWHRNPFKQEQLFRIDNYPLFDHKDTC